MKMNPWRRWLRWMKRDSDIDAEIEAHLAMAKQGLMESGESSAQAEQHAKRDFGNRTLIAEVTRDVWGWSQFERFGKDLKFGIRSLWKQPAFAIVSILLIALSVGANTAVFSVVYELLIRPLPYADAERIIDIATRSSQTGDIMPVSAPDFRDYHNQSAAFAAMSLYSAYSASTSAGTVAEFIEAASVSREFFDVFQVRALRGRLFLNEEFNSGKQKAAIISEGCWRSRYGADPHILGRTIRFSSLSLTVVGVLPEKFRFPDKTEIWLPLNNSYHQMSRGARNFRAVGRIKPGLALEQAQAQMNGIAVRLEQQYPIDNRGIKVQLTLLRDRLVADVRQSLLLLFGAVGTILLIAWVNLAGILLVRMTTRTREMATRLALGAARGQLWLQLLAEGAALAVPVAVLALLLAYAGRRALIVLASQDIGRLGNLPFDCPVLAFTAGLSIFTTLIFSCVPAWHACRLNPNHALKQFSGRHVGGTRHLRTCLVVGEIALSVVLLASAGLLVKSFYRLQNVDLGFRPQNVLVMTASYPTGRPGEIHKPAQFYTRLCAEIEAMPGVTVTGAMRSLPGEETWSSGGYVVNAPPRPGTITPEMLIKTAYVEASPGTFRTLGVPLIRGREFADSDTHEAPLVAIVNQAVVRHSFPNQDPVGRTIFCGLDQWSLQGMRIVGVAGDIHQFGPASPALPVIYMPNAQHPAFAAKMHILVRSSLDTASLTSALRSKVQKLSQNVPVKFSTLETLLAENTATARTSAFLIGILAVLALCLAMAGIYAVVAYLVVQRTGEIGIRMALGAGVGTVFQLVLREGIAMAVFGLTLGLAAAFAITRLFSSQLFEVKPNDPTVYVCMSMLMLLVTVLAVSVPAWRATRIDPITALRIES